MEKEAGRDSLKEIVRRNMVIWLATLKTKNPKEVSGLYSENNTFLPTVSGKFRKGKAEAEDYFVHFLEKNPEGEVVEEETQALGEDVYVHSGMYKFKIDGPERRQIVSARFTFVWRKESDGMWRIIHHHSSAKPEGE